MKIIKWAEVYEISLVLEAANPHCKILSVKEK